MDDENCFPFLILPATIAEDEYGATSNKNIQIYFILSK
jgi:hypothetical protein